MPFCINSSKPARFLQGLGLSCGELGTSCRLDSYVGLLIVLFPSWHYRTCRQGHHRPGRSSIHKAALVSVLSLIRLWAIFQIYFLGPADIMSEANETEPTPEEQRMRADLLQVTSELEYEKNHALFLG
jgi:hypothetical protein